MLRQMYFYSLCLKSLDIMHINKQLGLMSCISEPIIKRKNIQIRKQITDPLNHYMFISSDYSQSQKLIALIQYYYIFFGWMLENYEKLQNTSLIQQDSQLSLMFNSNNKFQIQQMLQTITDRDEKMNPDGGEKIAIDKEQISEKVLQKPQLVEQQQDQISSFLYLLFCYLYFIQGLVMGIIGTIPYVYPELPDIDTMLIFNNLSIPFSFKFLIAPLLQKYTNIEYGKRKTWIIVSQFIAATILFIASFFTSLEKARTFAILCFFIQIFMVVQNIALHALIVKQIKSAHQSSLIQSFAEVSGILFGSLLLLKLTSKSFANWIGLQHAITSPHVVLTAVVLIIILPLITIHRNFKQRTLQSEIRGSTFSVWKIIKNYDVFFKLKSKYYRFCVFVVVYNQGLNFFASLYDYQLVKAGFSRDTSNTIGNIVIIPIIVLTFYFKGWTQKLKGTRNAIMLSTSCTVIICFYICLIFPTDVPSIAIITFLLALFDGWRFYNFGVLINQFPIHALTGMYLTVFGSYFNFGRVNFIHGQLCKWFGWKQMSILGLFIQIIIVMMTPSIYNWVQNGDLTLSKDIQESHQEKPQKYQLMN